MTRPFGDASAGTLRALAAAIRTGRVAAPITRMGLQRATPMSENLSNEIFRFVDDGLSPPHLAVMPDLAADVADAAARHSPCELVWSGPEGRAAQSRDTAVVLSDLFAEAERRVTISTFVVRQTALVLGALSRRMEERPELHARIFLHVPRGVRDTRHESELLREFSDALRREWPGQRRPEVFYDPRSVSADRAIQATWHAKCVVVDDAVSFVTSANFTEWAQSRNVEAGVLIRDPNLAHQLPAQFDSLVAAGAVVRLPGF